MWYETALAVNGNYTDALNNKGVVLEDLGESEGALLLENKTRGGNENNSDAVVNKGNIPNELSCKSIVSALIKRYT